MTLEIRKTSEEWQDLTDTLVVDPDGWDRKGNFHYSWYEELITKEEYERREMVSTCMHQGGLDRGGEA